uniref:Odorant receptor n=1 Tax=Trichogramma kaykai TaxID=54128 RepID=A0ABD2XBA8_9HYME
MKIPIIGKPLEISLKLTGFWSDKVNKVVLALMWSSVLTTMPFSVWDAIRIRKNPLMLFDNLSVFLAQVLLYSKLLIFSYNRRLLRNLLREMENDFQSDPQLLRYIELSGNDPRRFCKYEFFVYLGASALFWVQIGFVYVAVPVEMREAVFKVYYPFDYKSSPVYEVLVLTQIIQGMLQCCIQAFSESLLIALISDDPTILVKFAGYYFCSCWQIFSFCLAGQRLLNKSDKIAMKMYETIWYKTSIKEIHAVAFIIKRSQKPLMLSVAKSTELSMVTFTQIMKTSFSCLSVLRACYN